MGAMLLLAGIDFGIQWVVGGVSALFATERFYDLTGSATFLLLTYGGLRLGGGGRASIFAASPRQLTTSAMICAWASRLGSFLFLRVLRAGEDVRFKDVKHDPKRFLIWWTIQGVWVFVTLLPSLILNLKRDAGPSRILGMRDYVGWLIWVMGFLVEVLADRQKTLFRSNSDNAGRFITSGLWSVSRHPNYFGEMIMWAGIWLSSSSVMSGLELLSVFSPAFVAFLIARVSGIPMLERMADKRWGEEPAYVAYRDSTALLIPYLW